MEHQRSSKKRHNDEVSQRHYSDSELPPTKKRMNDYTVATIAPRGSSSIPTFMSVADTEVSEADIEKVTTINPPMSGNLPPTNPPAMSKIVDLSVDIVHKKMKIGTPDFPRFASGDIYIELSFMHSKYSYRLHSTILFHASPWFREAVQQVISEPDELLAEKVRKATRLQARFELNTNLEVNMGLLSRVPFTMISAQDTNDNKGEVALTPTTIQSSKLLSPPESVALEARLSEYEVVAVVTTGDVERPVTVTNPVLKVEDEDKSAVKTAEDEEAEAEKKKQADAAEMAKKKEVDETDMAKEKEFEEAKIAKTKEAAAANKQRRRELLEAYNNLFLTYYSKTPNFDQCDIQKAFRQAELLVQIADIYGSVSIVRPHISNAVMNFGREVYKAILQDPPRWLYISIFLESAPIFKEAVVHIVGNYPHWRSKTIDLPGFPSEIRAFLKSKTSDLQSMKIEIDKRLFMSSIRIEGEEIRLDKKDKAAYNTWIVVNYWRDWFSRSLATASMARRSCIDGDMYRLMAKGGEAYLSLLSVRASIKAMRCLDDGTGMAGQEIEEDLRLMKEFAQRTVKPLCVNNSMLSAEEDGIAHFTCIKVENHELPWVKKAEI